MPPKKKDGAKPQLLAIKLAALGDYISAEVLVATNNAKRFRPRLPLDSLNALYYIAAAEILGGGGMV